MERLDYSLVGYRIRRERKKHHWTQEKLAEKIEISPSFLGHIERGDRIPSIETLAQLCRVLHVDMNVVVWGEPYERPADEKERIMNYLQEQIDAMLK